MFGDKICRNRHTDRWSKQERDRPGGEGGGGGGGGGGEREGRVREREMGAGGIDIYVMTWANDPNQDASCSKTVNYFDLEI